MDDLLLDPRTKAELAALMRDPPQGLLLTAPSGSGKYTVAMAWARNLTVLHNIATIEPDDKSTISIEAIRNLYQRTRSKTPGRQIVIIDHAEAMGAEAQNAFLKLLEEPRPNLTFILTAPQTEALLPTILSRVQVLALLPVADAALKARAGTTVDAQSLAQILFVAAGRPATFMTLLTDSAAFAEHKAMMEKAKQLLGASAYERLVSVQELCKDRSATIATLEALAYMLATQIRKNPTENLLHFADRLQLCLSRLQNNGNLRAQLTHLFAE